MDYLIIVAIVAVALLMTGLTNPAALRRPFRSKSDRPGKPADDGEPSRSKDAPPDLCKPEAQGQPER